MDDNNAREPDSRKQPLPVEYIDVVAVVAATVPALVLGAPVLGFLVGAGGWLLQRILAKTDRRLIGRAREPRTQLGLNLFEAFGRIWLLAGAIVIAGVAGGRPDGLCAALVIFGAYSIAFAVRVLSGPPARSQATGAGARGGAPVHPKAAGTGARGGAPVHPKAAGAGAGRRAAEQPQPPAAGQAQPLSRSVAR
ncbi:MAG: hypothetical protein ACYCYN_01355 [Solirubrobacteraceae bacterium]